MPGDGTASADDVTGGSGSTTSALVRVREWVLIDANRLFLALSLSAGAFVLFIALDAFGFIAFTNDDSVTRLAGGMVAGTFSLVTIVVSINQLILSQEFSSAGRAADRIEEVTTFRSDVADAIDAPIAPGTPSQLLGALTDRIHQRTDSLRGHADDTDENARSELERYIDAVEDSIERVDDTLSTAAFGTFDAVSATIEYDAAMQHHGAMYLLAHHESALSPAAREDLRALIETFELFLIAREHFKTTYLQRELTRFSQLTLVIGVPAITSAMLIGFLYAGRTGPVVSLTSLPFVVSGLLAVVFSPLALLTVYILRTATVTRRTASVGPMLPTKDPDRSIIESLEASADDQTE
ncbi:hypothetical protein [Natronosalvus vescus]|uniref:hypothetical protein n=1 Tax=Natronosalvus vescus TaxID=2953881 RepID=UPI00209036A5|nr:hypothetical protein [Natronosalvus vescus]